MDEMQIVTWDDVSDYVSTGNLSAVTIANDFDQVLVQILYIGQKDQDAPLSTATFTLQCLDCCYLDLRRRDDHEPGSGVIREASLSTNSELMAALRNHELAPRKGTLRFEDGEESLYHIELVGEVNLNVLCKDVVIRSTPMRVVGNT